MRRVARSARRQPRVNWPGAEERALGHPCECGLSLGEGSPRGLPEAKTDLGFGAPVALCGVPRTGTFRDYHLGRFQLKCSSRPALARADYLA